MFESLNYSFINPPPPKKKIICVIYPIKQFRNYKKPWDPPRTPAW